MFSNELLNLLVEVITSWQVIAVVIAVVIYISLVSFVARTYRRPSFVSMSPTRLKKSKKSKPAGNEGLDGEPDAEISSNEELGLEE